MFFDVESVFDLAQKSKLSHPECMRNLKQLYQNMEFSKFSAAFIKCLKVCFEYPENLSSIEAALEFASKFTVSLSEGLEEDETCPFLSSVFHFLFEIHDSDKFLIRLRACEFVNRLLNDMGQDASLDDEICEKIGECLLERIQDKMPKVRAQAVYALHRLQQPSNASCNIVKVFLFHMSMDPSYEVRRAIVEKIAINKRTLPILLKRVNDVKDTVRKEAYMVLNKIPVQRFTIKQRQKLLSSGLRDRSESVQEYVRSVLVKSWLKAFDFKYTDFLHALYVETNTDVVILALKATFKYHHDVTLSLMLKEMYIENKNMPYSRLTPESVVMWRAMAEYLHSKEGMEETFEQILPDLTVYCAYIRQYYLQGNTGNDEPPNEYILSQLLEMTRLFDLSDEVGRQHLRQLCIDLLQFSLVTEKSAALITKLLIMAIPDLNERLNKMAEIISELREPFETAEDEPENSDVEELQLRIAKLGVTLNELRENQKNAINSENFLEAEEIKKIISETEQHVNELKQKLTPEECNDFQPKDDVPTIKKCLTIVVTMLQSRDVRAMNPTLHSLMENFVFPCLQKHAEDNTAVHRMALKCIGIFGLLDINIAKEKFIIFLSQIQYPVSRDIEMVALDVTFDYLHLYGLATFDILQYCKEGDESEATVFERNCQNLISALIKRIDSECAEIRNIAVAGLCRLLYSRRLTSPDLVAKLILLWFTSDAENGTHVHQTLGVFFSQYATRCPNAQQTLLQAFIFVVKKFNDEDYADKFVEVDQDSVTQLLIRLTQPRINRHVRKGICIHNKLAIKICDCILAGEPVDVSLLVRCFPYLQLDYSIKDDITALLKSISSVINTFQQSGDKANHRLVDKFSNTVESRKNAAINPVVNTAGEESNPDIPNIATMEIENITPFTLLSGKLNLSGDEEEDEKEDDEEEDDEVETGSNQGGFKDDDNEEETATIPETPESSEISQNKGSNDEDEDDFDSEVSSNFQTPARNTRSRTAVSTQRKLKLSTVRKRK